MEGVRSSQEVSAALQRVTERLAFLRDHGTGKFVCRGADRPVIHTRMQALFNLKFSDALDRALYELLVTHAVSAEKVGPGGFDRCIELFLDGRPQGSLDSAAHVATSGELTQLVTTYARLGGPKVTAIVGQALHLAGLGGRVIIEKTSASIASVERVRGYTFELQQLLPQDVSFVGPRVACIDGYVEDVAEVHHLLEAAASAKEPCIVFLRGISEDVKHTLKTNYDRGSLRVVPIAVRFDLEGMNTLIDLSIAAGCDLVSSLKGDLISSIKFEELPYVDQVTVFRGRVVMLQHSTHARVSSHVAQLRVRREAEKVGDVGSLLDKRIKSLSPNHVVIRLPDDKDFVTSSQAIDYALRAVRSAIEHGIDPSGFPVATELAAQTYASRFTKLVSELGTFLIA